MEQGKASASKSYHQIWSKLDEQGVSGEGHAMESLEEDFKSLLIVPSNSKHSTLELLSDEVEIHSDVEDSSFENQGWCKITRNSDLCSETLQNKSLNANFVDATDVPTEDASMIRCGSEIVYGPVSDGYLSYKFRGMPMNEPSMKVFKISLDSEHVKCSICLNIWYDVVTVAPCLHNFCNGCFSRWSRRSQENHTTVVCPHCSSDVQSVGRNRFLHRIVEEIWQSREEELAVVNSYALTKSLPVINHRKKPRSKRPRKCSMPEEDIIGNSSMPEEDIIGTDPACAQCGTEHGGFQCNQNTLHLQCACGGMMPYRTDIPVPQICIGCDKAFCGAYWHSQQVTNYSYYISDSYYMCAPETFKPLGERSISRIPLLAHKRNRHEQNITIRCIQQMGKTLQDVVSEWVTKLDNQEIDLTTMPLNHADMITSGTHICNRCYDKLVSFLLYWFRIDLPKDHLPEDAAQREDCWYGYICRTQHNNASHARKRNHVCPPTKGDIGN